MKQTLADALAAKGYDTLTAVQQSVTEDGLEGKDMLVSAQTGSGKTLGFGLAIAPAVLGDEERFDKASAPLALVIAPTRELALQVKRELAWLYEKAGAVVASTVGGMDMRDERRALARGAHIVVATPGRLRDHIMRGSIDLYALRAIVLDEADEMLDLGFREDLEFILEAAPEDRQTLLFSATVPPAIAKLAKSYQQDAIRIEAAGGAKQHADIEYHAYRVANRDGENAIINVLRYYEAPNAIVFCNTRATVNRMTTRLSNRGFSVVALSGELTQSERTNALQAMRDGRARVCVATDVAARGIDLPNLDLVIHAELPTNQETLLHRSGRTGRAGRKGVSAMIVPPSSRRKAERLLGWAKLTAEWNDAPNADAVMAKDEERMLASSDWGEAVSEGDSAMVAKLSETFSAEQLAAAYLRLFRERHTAPEELSDANEPKKPREAFGKSVWFSLAGGRAVGADPRRLLPMLCKMGDVSRDEIGAIRIQAEETFFEIKESSADKFLASVGPGMTMEDDAALVRLDTPPKLDRGPRKPDRGPRKDFEKRDAKPRPPRKDRDAPKKPSAAPIEWNDDPAPKKKKPKADKPPFKKSGDKPPFKKGGDKPPFKKKSKSEKARDDGAISDKPRKPRHGASDPSKRMDGPPRGKGPKPPVSKPNSKKNKARRAAEGGKPFKAGGKGKGFKPKSKS